MNDLQTLGVVGEDHGTEVSFRLFKQLSWVRISARLRAESTEFVNCSKAGNQNLDIMLEITQFWFPALEQFTNCYFSDLKLYLDTSIYSSPLLHLPHLLQLLHLQHLLQLLHLQHLLQLLHEGCLIIFRYYSCPASADNYLGTLGAVKIVQQFCFPMSGCKN